jgi:hypothetical protein
VKARLVGGIAALLVAIIGTVLLVNYVQNADKRALADTETESVYVVEKTISAGTGIDKAAGAVVRKEVPKLAVAVGAVTDLNQVGQKVAAVDLMPGEQLLTTRMVDANSILGPARVPVPAGMQEITLKLPIERVVGGTLAAGDTVGVFLSVEDTACKVGPDPADLSQGPGHGGPVQQRQHRKIPRHRGRRGHSQRVPSPRRRHHRRTTPTSLLWPATPPTLSGSSSPPSSEAFTSRRSRRTLRRALRAA